MKSKPVSKQVRKALPLLKFLANVPDNRIRTYNLKLLDGDPTVFDAMREISGNYLKGRIKLNSSQSKRLARKKDVLKKFHCSKVRRDCKLRNKVLVQSGGILPLLIPAAATVISTLLSKLLTMNK